MRNLILDCGYIKIEVISNEPFSCWTKFKLYCAPGLHPSEWALDEEQRIQLITALGGKYEAAPEDRS